MDNSDVIARIKGPNSSLEGGCPVVLRVARSVLELTTERLVTFEDANIRLTGSNNREMDRDR